MEKIMFDLGNAEKNQLLDERAENKYYSEDYQIDVNDKNNTKIIIKDYIEEGSTCLDVGCGAGYLGEILKKYKKAKVYGVDVDQEALVVAKKKGCFEEVYNFSITERMGDDYEKFVKTKTKFDYIIFADVLEHVVSADEMLLFFSKYLKPGGKLITSLPNVAHFDIVRGLINRKFNYNHIGLLDNTHLRFYTKSSFGELIEQINKVNGVQFGITEIGKTVIEPGYIQQYPKMYGLLNQDGEACVLQYVYAITIDGKGEGIAAEEKTTFDELENKLSEADKLRARVTELEMAVDNIYKSKSWKIMKPVRGASRAVKKITGTTDAQKEMNLETNAQKLVKMLRMCGVRVAVVATYGGATKAWAEELKKQGCQNVLIGAKAGKVAPMLKELGFKVVAMIDRIDWGDAELTESERNANFYADYLIFKDEEVKKIFQEKFDKVKAKTKVLPWRITWGNVREIAKCFKETVPIKIVDVTAVIPNYNYEKYLPMRIESILAQTVKPREIILLDDNSSDGSVAVAKPILEKAQTEYGIEYRIIKNQKNMGCFKQWCKGFKEAKFPLVWMAEADDYARPNFLETVLPSFEDKEAVISYTKSCKIDSDSITDNYDFNWYIEELDKSKWTKDFVDGGPEFVKKYLADRNSIPNASAIVMRKSAAEGIETELGNYQAIGDWFAYIYIIAQGNVYYHADVLNGFRRHDESIIAKKEQSPVFLKEKKAILKYLHDRFLKNSQND